MDDSLQHIASMIVESASASEQANKTAAQLEQSAGMFSTGLMTQLLASARNADDFRFAAGRRAVRLWTLSSEAYLLGLDNNNLIDQDPIAQWRRSVPEANLSSIDGALQQLMSLAKKLSNMKGSAALFDEISNLHAAAKTTTDAITAEEVRVLANAGQGNHRATAGIASASAKAKPALPPAAKKVTGSKDEWADF